MAKGKKRKSTSRARARSSRSTRASRASSPRAQDAIGLLKADHRQVEQWFEQFESARSDDKKQALASDICQALKVHTQIEAEIFYPAFLEATEEEGIHHEAEVEHAGAKNLIAQIEGSSPEDEYYDAKVTVLSEMIKHHVREEEKSDGMFAKARQADMDLKGLGERLAARKAELMGADEEDERGSGQRNRPGSGRADSAVPRMARRARGD
jgi:hemerythrin superfamily protein